MRKTAMLVAVLVDNGMMPALMAIAAFLPPICNDRDPIVELFAQLPKKPNESDYRLPGVPMAFLSIVRGLFDDAEVRSLGFKSLRRLLPAMRNRDTTFILQHLKDEASAPISNECMAIFLQHGTCICYCTMYLTMCSDWATKLRQIIKQHSERFIELLRAADTDFSGVLEQIASVDKKKWAPLNLAVLDRKLSQPLSLQTSCVINLRRQLWSVSDCGLWASIDQLPLPPIIRERIKLKMW